MGGGEGCGQGLFGFGKRCVRCDFLRGGGEAGGGSVSKIFLAVPLSCRVSAASLVSVCRAWKGVFKHGNRSAVTRCHFFCVSSSASGKLRDASVGNLRGDSRAVL